MFTVLKEDDTSKGFVKAWIGTKDNPIHFEDKARKQLFNLAKMPFVEKWVSVMPDVHFGTGSTIGCVFLTKDAIIPAAVGLDVGCSVAAIRLSVTIDQLEKHLNDIYVKIREVVPTGRSDKGSTEDWGRWKDIPFDVKNYWDTLFKDSYNQTIFKNPGINPRRNSVSVEHLGTLGGGNHFIELGVDEDGYVWVMVHTGSRGVGARVANFFIRQAKEECDRWYIDLPHPDLAYFPSVSPNFKNYIEAITWLQLFSTISKKIIMQRIFDVIKDISGLDVKSNIQIECQHNFIKHEHHFGTNYLITRKGAVNAFKGTWVIIPGAQATRTYICEGLGNPDSFNSCSHGGGRLMSRTDCKKTFTLEEHIKSTEGIICDKTIKTIDETSGGYKDIDGVMAAQQDLVKPIFVLKPVLNIKGMEDKDE